MLSLINLGAHMSVTLAQASTILDAALKKGRDTSCAPLTVAVLDAGGHLVAFKREDKSGLLRFDIAFGKAWGALGMGFLSYAQLKRSWYIFFFQIPLLPERLLTVLLLLLFGFGRRWVRLFPVLALRVRRSAYADHQ